MANGDADVVVKIGGDLSPIQRTFAQLKVQAAQAGEAAGISFGDRTGYMAEQRVRRGMDGVLRSLATAKDPIDAISGAIEGLGQSFRIAGAAFLGIGIGTFLKDQLEKAAAGAQEFYDNDQKVFAAGKQSSREFLETSVKAFNDNKIAYGKEGFFEWLIYGAGQKKSLVAEAEKNAENLKRLSALVTAQYKADADSRSEDVETRLQGEIEKVNERYEAERAKAGDNAEAVVQIRRSQEEEIAALEKKADDARKERIEKLIELMQTFEGLAEKFKIQQIDQSQGKDAGKATELNDNVTATRREYVRLDNTAGTSPDKVEKAKLEYEQAITAVLEYQQELAIKANEKYSESFEKEIEAKKQGVELQQELAEIGMTDAEKRAALEAKIAKEKKDLAGFVGPMAPGQKQEAENQITKDQIKLKGSQTSDKKKLAALDVEKAKLEAAGSKPSVFGGHVSSLRREGFGKTPGGSNAHDSVKIAQESAKHLADINKQIAALIAKVGGVA